MASAAVAALTASDALAGSELFYADGLVSAAASDCKVTATQIKTWCSASPTITGHATIEGVVTTGATGTGKFVFDGSPTLVAPVIGVATGTSLAVSGLLTSSSATAGLGYATGAGGTVTQATNKSTGVTLNKTTGTITMNNANLVTATAVGFTLTNSTIAATDIPVVAIKSGATAASYTVTVDAVAAGSCKINLHNFTAGDLAEAVVLSFAVIKGVAA